MGSSNALLTIVTPENMTGDNRLTHPARILCGSVTEWLGRWTCDLQVASSNPGLPAVECNPEQVVNTHVPLSPSSIIWYQPIGGNALRLGT